jgi:CheY-like chemotaxis protein
MVRTEQKRILIVDDEEHIAWVLQKGLRTTCNCEIVTAASGEEAQQLFAEHPFDILITDFKMTGIDGLTLARHVRQLYPHTAIVLLSAYSGEALRKQTARNLIQYILDKPVKLKVIRRVVSEILSK